MSDGQHIVDIDGDNALIQWLSSNHRKRHCLLGSIIELNITSQSIDQMSNIQLLENQSPVESATMDTTDNNRYASVRIPDGEWNTRLQDKGCSKAMMPQKHYYPSQIPPIGTDGA